MNSGQVHILIGKGESGELATKDQIQPEVEKKNVEGNDTAKQAIFTALIQSGQQAINQGIALYGQITGDTTTIQAIQGIANVSADALIIAKGGVVGAIAVGTKYALQAGTSFVNTYQQNRQIALNNQLLGDVSIKGSRYF